MTMHPKARQVPNPSKVARENSHEPVNRHAFTARYNPHHLVAGALVFQVVLLCFAGWHNRNNLNPDGIAYLRIASYYATAKTQLMVSGYWGPLLSWLMAPWLMVGVPALWAARIVMALSAVVFWCGGIVLFRVFQLSVFAQVTGAWLLAVTSVFWSVEYISPDLLVAGLMGLAIGQIVSPNWVHQRSTQYIAGVFWGLAYLAKAVALPLAFAVTTAIAVLYIVTRLASPRAVFRSWLASLIVCLLIAAPWIIVLSAKYHNFTFSTTARIAHAVVGPPDVPRYHPLGRMFFKPEPGRITAWEDPSEMPYAYWSPFANSAYARHQWNLAVANAATICQLFSDFDYLYLGLAGMILTLILPPLKHPSRSAPSSGAETPEHLLRDDGQPKGYSPAWLWRLAQDRWRWTLAPLLCLAGIYLPGYVKLVDERYFYLAYPLILICAWNGVLLVAQFVKVTGRPIQNHLLICLAAVSFAVPAVRLLPVAMAGLPNPANAAAQELAERLKAANISGPIAGSGMILGNRAGLYTAYYLEQPWLGDVAHPAPADYLSSRAQLIIVNRGQAIVPLLEQNPTFRNLDNRLFASADEAAQFPLKVYQITGASE